ncbi:MAG TPA: hypothetical protein VHP81_04850 [Lachnospiraceae bacterium]|nr:hypothetical protein [Lachnospiraceae bacterium]
MNQVRNSKGDPEERKAFFQCELARYVMKGCDRMQHIDYAVLDFLYIETE